MRARSIRLPLLALLIAGVAASACAGGDDAMTDSGEESASEGTSPRFDEAGMAESDMATTDVGGVDRDLIIEMSLSIESESISRSVSLIEAAVRAEQGLVTSSEVSSMVDDEARAEGWARIVARVPPDDLDDFLDRLDRPDEVGRITSRSQRTEDVTEQLVELDVRIENQRESVTAVRRLMAEATDLTDLVLLEGELTRRQTDLEILLARQADLAGRVAMATVTIDVYAPGSAPDPDRSVLDGFVDGWRAFVAVVGGLGWFLAAVSPFVVVGVVVAVAVVTILRRRHR
ncbi:MAG: hypothetical protein RIR49_972 [Actinomycetota bacterium]|jgi:hypothetical protein